MAERKLRRPEEHRPVRRAPDDHAGSAGDQDAEQDYLDEDDLEEDDAEYDGDAGGEESADAQPDVLLHVPVLKVEEINLEVEDLNARVSLEAEVLKLLKLHVGADVSIGRVSLDLKGVDAVALLKVRLDEVAAIIEQVMMTIRDNPQILTDLTRGLGEAASEVGEGAGEALEEVGQGAGEALEEVGGGAGSAIEAAGGGVEQAVGGLGEGVGRAAGDVIEDVGDTVERPPSPSGESPRRVRRQEPPAGAGSPRREPEARPRRRRRPE